MAFVLWLLVTSVRWLLAQALPGANRLIKHLRKKKVPFALASNSMTKNVEAKVSHQPGSFFYYFIFSGHCGFLTYVICVLSPVGSPFTCVFWLFYFVSQIGNYI